MRLYLLLFIVSLCFFATLRFTANPKMIPTKETNISNTMHNKVETIAVYTPIHIHAKFSCLKIALKNVYVLQQKNTKAAKLSHIPKGQKLCLNFPQDIPNTSLQITLKALEDNWLLVAIMGESVLLRGYIPLQSIKNWDKLHAVDMQDYSSGGDFLLNAPKIISNSLGNVSGSFSMRHILQIAKEKLNAKDYDSARAWLALAQTYNPSELEIYDLYAILLKYEGKNEEALNLMKMLTKARNKMDK